MKRIGNLYNKIISIENLQLADRKARKGKLRSYGVKQHDKNRESNILALHEILKNKAYKTSEYDIFTIYEPKERKIFRLPYYPDRIVHHAIMNILEPIWIKIFTYNTYSCIKNRGIEGCARRVTQIIKKYKNKPLYCLKIDIKKFYPSINHSILKQIVRKKIKDKDLLWLLDEIIDSTEGVPIGNYLSQFFANLYLAYFMHFVNEQLRINATEYADDICFFSDNKEQLHKIIPIIKEQLSLIQLEIKDNYQIFPIAVNKYDKHGIALYYVGYKFYKNQKLLRKSIKKNLCKRTCHLNKLTYPLKEYKQKNLFLAWVDKAQ